MGERKRASLLYLSDAEGRLIFLWQNRKQNQDPERMG